MQGNTLLKKEEKVKRKRKGNEKNASKYVQLTNTIHVDAAMSPGPEPYVDWAGLQLAPLFHILP